MRFLYFLSLTFFVGLLASCGEEQHQKEQTEINEMKKQLQTQLTLLETVDSAVLEEMKPFYDRTKKLTQKYYILNDSMEVDSQFAAYMNQIKALKNGPKYAANYGMVKQRLKNEVKQLEILTEDLAENAKKTVDKKDEFMEHERKNVAILVDETKVYVDLTSELIQTYQNIQPYISNFTDSLKRANE